MTTTTTAAATTTTTKLTRRAKEGRVIRETAGRLGGECLKNVGRKARTGKRSPGAYREGRGSVTGGRSGRNQYPGTIKGIFRALSGHQAKLRHEGGALKDTVTHGHNSPAVLPCRHSELTAWTPPQHHVLGFALASPSHSLYPSLLASNPSVRSPHHSINLSLASNLSRSASFTSSSSVMSFFGRAPQAPSGSINPQQIEMAETELSMISDIFDRIVRSCHSKCISEKYAEPDLNKGEGVCIDRCVAKFFEVNAKVGERMQTMGGAAQAGGSFGQ